MGLGGCAPDVPVRLFVDVGSHEGQTLEEVTKPGWDFAEVHGIEPMPREFDRLWSRFGGHPRVVLHNFALSFFDGTARMYGTNDELEASPFPDKDDVDPDVVTEVGVRSASGFFAALDGEVWVNMNCEGAEALILDDLILSGEVKRIHRLLVDFDIRKVPSQRHEERRLREALTDMGVAFSTDYPEDLTHQEQIAAWLRRG